MSLKNWLAIFFCISAAAGAGAQQGGSPLGGFSIGVRPQLIDLTGPAGARRSFDLYVRNFDTLRPAKVWLWVADALQTPTGALEFGDAGAYEYSAARWLKLDQSELTIMPGKEVKVKVTMLVPGNTKGSGHAIVVASGAPPKNVPIAPTRENQAFVVTRVSFGVIFHYAVPGTAVPGAKIESLFLTSDPPPNSGLTKKTSPYKRWLVARVRNTGNVMIYGYGWALLRRANVGLMERWRLGQKEYGTRKVIYPGRHLDMYMPVSRPLPTGDYVAQIRLDYAPSRAATAEVPLAVTADEAADAFQSETGAFATQTIGLAVTVEKELETLRVAPGGVRTGTIKVTNNEAVPLQVEAALMDVTMDGDGVLVPSQNATPASSAASWLSIGPQQFSLPPGKSRRVSYAAAPAYDLAHANDLVGLVRFRARQLDAIARVTQDEVIGETGVLVIASQAGRGQLKADIGVLQVDVRPELPGIVRVGVPVRNVGNVHFLPTVNLRLAGIDNPAFQAERTQGNDEAHKVLILPGRERIVWFELPATQFQPGQYTAAVTVDYGGTTVQQRSFNIKLHDPSAPPPPAKPEQPKPQAPEQGGLAGGQALG
ncbi:MAG: hypothetical protein ABFE07_15545 [Armatimonadia bacterium]